MKISTIALCFLITACVSSVHAVQAAEDIDNSHSKRLLITAKQRQMEANFTKEEAECYKKFAVNNCLEKISTNRRTTSAQLKEEENLLNDLARKDKGAQQISRMRANSSAEKLLQNTDREMKSGAQYQERIAQKKDRQVQVSADIANKTKSLAASEMKRSAKQKQIQLRSEKETEAFENAKQFEERQKAAVQRKIQYEADQQKRDKSLSKPLPLPAVE